MGVFVRLFGGLQVQAGAAPIRAWTWQHRRAAQLVALLALAPHRRLHREQVVEALWPGLPPKSAFANLHKAAHHARRALGAADAVVLRQGVVNLWPHADVVTDVDVFERAARSALATGDPAACAEAAGLYGGELLSEFPYEEWAHRTGESLRQLWLDVLRQAGRWQEVAAAEPADEQAQRQLMVAEAEAGNPHAAIRRFRWLRDLLTTETGTLPSKETVAVYERISARLQARTSTPASVRTPMVGREAELARARALRDRAAASGGCVLFVRGEAGIGKTRLCQELLAEAEASGWLTLGMTGRPGETAVAYRPVGEGLTRFLMAHPHIAQKLSEPTRSMLSELGAAVPGGSPIQERPLARQQVLGAVTQLLAAMTQQHPTVLLLDDAHAADEASLQLVASVARAMDAGRLLTVVASRPPVPAVLSRLADHGYAVEMLDLGPLAPDQARELLPHLTARPPTDESAATVWRLAGGNPFLTELAADVVAPDGSLRQLEDAGEVIATRLASHAPALADALPRAAVAAGSAFDADEFAALTGLAATKAHAALDAACTCGLVEVAGDGYRFRHILVREALAAQLPPHRRAAVHRAAARRLERSGAPPAVVAGHLLAAGDGPAAATWLAEAARHAAAVGAPDDALTAVDTALQHTPDAPELLALRADVLFALGDGAAPGAYARAVAAARPAARDELRVKHAWALITAGDVQDAAHVLDRVADLQEGESTRLVIARGMVAWFRGDIDAAATAAWHARRQALEAAETVELFDAATLQAMVAHSRGSLPARLRREVFATRHLPELATTVFDGGLCLVEDYLYSGERYEDVIAFAHELRRVAARLGAARGEAFATVLLGEAELLAGRLDHAERHLTAGLHQHRAIGAATGEALARQRLAEVALACDRREDARAAARKALAVARTAPATARHLLSRVYGTLVRAAADPRAALHVLDEAELSIRGPEEFCAPCAPHLLLPAAVACA